MSPATNLLIVLTAGVVSQWLAWRLRLPSIVILIAAGLLIGPLTGVLQIGLGSAAFTSLIGLGVAIILFEGGLDLELREFRRVGHGIGRLVVAGPPLAWGLGALAAHYVGGLSWPVALVLGAILVVTGPTVIIPMLRGARLNQDSASLLKWEGIVNDPVGVLLAVLTYQYFTSSGTGHGLNETLLALGGALVASLVLGGIGGWLIGRTYQLGYVPEHLKPPLMMVLVMVVYSLTNQVQHEAGLLAVTLMGMVLGNMPLGGLEELRRFKQSLGVLLISVLFILLTANLKLADLGAIGWRTIALFAALLVVVRPLAVWLATLGAKMRAADRTLLAWFAPRGIVAAATAGLFGPGLIAAGFADAAVLQPAVFGVILLSVLGYGLSLGPLARRLELSAPAENGLLIVGASPWTTRLAEVLKDLGLSVLIVDGVWQRLKTARLAGLEVYYGEILSEHARDWVATHHLNHVLCATRNDFYNALICKALARQFGQHRAFQLALAGGAAQEQRRLSRQQRGHVAFAEEATLDRLNERLEEGWVIQRTPLNERYSWERWREQMGPETVLIGALDPNGMLRLHSPELRFAPGPGWRILSFAPAGAAAGGNGTITKTSPAAD